MRLYGYEAGGDGLSTGRHAASISGGPPGVLHGARSYLLQDEDGQTIAATRSRPGWTTRASGPEHAFLHDSAGRRTSRSPTPRRWTAFRLLARTEGIIPAIESAHAVAGAQRLARELGPDATILINLSGRGDKDVETAIA